MWIQCGNQEVFWWTDVEHWLNLDWCVITRHFEGNSRMDEDHPQCGQPSDRGTLKTRQDKTFNRRLNEIGGRTLYKSEDVGPYVQSWFWRLPICRSSKSLNAKPERERECVKVKTLTYSPSTDSCYNKICILCIASFSVTCTKYQSS